MSSGRSEEGHAPPEKRTKDPRANCLLLLLLLLPNDGLHAFMLMPD